MAHERKILATSQSRFSLISDSCAYCLGGAAVVRQTPKNGVSLVRLLNNVSFGLQYKVIFLQVPLLMDDDTIAFGEEDAVQKGQLTHPYVTFFHLAFRVTAIATYMLCGWFSNSFIASFVSVILLLSMDFWTVKNITGRLMVGLRWWNYVDDNGVSHWVFESRKNRINPSESRIFWMALILSPILWGIFVLVALFGLKLKWMLLAVIALILNGANLYGYFKCKMGGDKDISSATSDFFKKQVIQNMATMMTRSPPNAGNMNQPTNII
uniref:Golgi apparatus membrane protein TVP23 homolog n=1 Tax=Trichogramma kaykai TaxID=54128 RepID=A0ABD2WRB7_9HYME